MTIVPDASVPWENGLEAIQRLSPEWRANLGPEEQLADAYRRFNIKVLRVDERSGARFEVLRADPGYADLTDAYHDTVEESFCIDGSITLSGEATMVPGTYFWRPPGFIHGAATEVGFHALLMVEGVSPGDASGPVTRRIRPRSEAGANALEPDLERAVGPRGFVHHVQSRFLPWIAGRDFARGQERLDGYDLDHAEFKLLSQNAATGAQSLLVRLGAGFAQAGEHRHAATQQFYVLEGELRWGERTLAQSTYVHREAGAVAPPLESPAGAVLFMKTAGRLDFRPLAEDASAAAGRREAAEAAAAGVLEYMRPAFELDLGEEGPGD